MNTQKAILLTIICSFFLTNCQTPLRTARTNLSVETFENLERRLKNTNAKLSFFQKFGPFKYKKTTNQSLQVTKKTLIEYDMFAPQHEGNSPLVIISHGNKSLKEAHRFQAERSFLLFEAITWRTRGLRSFRATHCEAAVLSPQLRAYASPLVVAKESRRLRWIAASLWRFCSSFSTSLFGKLRFRFVRPC